jgi:RHS repeat-associated protein
MSSTCTTTSAPCAREHAQVRSISTGKERDLETGLDFFGARYMSSAQGRFTSPDPANGINPFDPQSWNAYTYAGNNPLARVDPDGLDWTVCEGNSSQNETNCGTIKNDKDFEKYAKSQGWEVKGGNLYDSDGNQLGTAHWTDGATERSNLAGARQIANTASWGEPLLGVTLAFIQGPGMSALGVAGPEMAGLAIAERGVSAPPSKYEDVTSPNSRPNRQTDISRADFEKNLSSSGWSKSTSQDGRVSIYMKDGARYVVRDNAKSTGGPTADYYGPGSKGIDLKIRLK